MLRWLTAGESHGPALVAVLEGLPAGVEVTSKDIQAALARRRLGHGRGARMAFEADELELIGGIRHGLTMGSPIALRIGNSEWPKWEQVMSADPVDADVLDGLKRNAPLTRPRPGHADLAGNIRYYSALFGAAPTVVKPDYAKWLLDDPRLNFAISARGAQPGLDHLGLQVTSPEELAAQRERLQGAELALEVEGETTCCYARSDKHWSTDPQGIAWETFQTLGEAPTFNGGTAEPAASACCTNGLKFIGGTPWAKSVSRGTQRMTRRLGSSARSAAMSGRAARQSVLHDAVHASCLNVDVVRP